MANRGCTNEPDKFCYICRELTIIKYWRNMTDRDRGLYFAYFGCKIGDEDKRWATNHCCCDCINDLNQWCSGKKLVCCYFWITDIKGHTQKTKKNIQYPNLPSAIRPVSHSYELPVPKPPSSVDCIHMERSDCDSDESLASEYVPEDTVPKPHLIDQEDLSDLIRNLNLTKEKSEILSSRLQEWHLLAPEVKVAVYCNRSKHLVNNK